MPANILSNNYSTQQIFLGKKYIEYETITNSTGSTMTLSAGRLMGQILASGKWLAQVSTATDGSEFPRGILYEDQSIADGATVSVPILKGGDVNENGVILGGSDTWATAIRTVSTGGATVRAAFLANCPDIKLFPSTELSNYDN